MSMKTPLITININDGESLLEACELLHDARIDLSTICHDEQNETWCGTFERGFFEEPSLMTRKRRFLIFEKVLFPLVESKLTLSGVKRIDIHDASQIGIYMFNECKLDNGVATLIFCEDLEMEITFSDKPHGALIDQKALDKQGVIWIIRNPFR